MYIKVALMYSDGVIVFSYIPSLTVIVSMIVSSANLLLATY